jgi:hypothetical protein
VTGWWQLWSRVVSQVRFQVLFGPASLHPQRMGWGRPDGSPVDGDDLDLPGAPVTSPVRDTWFGWRLMGANNRELGRSARSFDSYPLARRAVGQLQQDVARLVPHSAPDPATGRWAWRLELDGVAVAVSGRWYERDHDARLGAAKFVSLSPGAELTDGVVTLHDRRGPGNVRLSIGGPR